MSCLYSRASQTAIIEAFKIDLASWSKQFGRPDQFSGMTLFHADSAVCDAVDNNTIITQSILDKLLVRPVKTYLYVLGAVRFRDAAGRHESHSCSLMTSAVLINDNGRYSGGAVRSWKGGMF
jgi:hypothetical protein